MLVWANALFKHRAIFAAIALLSFDNFSRSALKAHPSSVAALRRAATGPAEELGLPSEIREMNGNFPTGEGSPSRRGCKGC